MRKHRAVLVGIAAALACANAAAQQQESPYNRDLTPLPEQIIKPTVREFLLQVPELPGSPAGLDCSAFLEPIQDRVQARAAQLQKLWDTRKSEWQRRRVAQEQEEERYRQDHLKKHGKGPSGLLYVFHGLSPENIAMQERIGTVNAACQAYDREKPSRAKITQALEQERKALAAEQEPRYRKCAEQTEPDANYFENFNRCTAAGHQSYVKRYEALTRSHYPKIAAALKQQRQALGQCLKDFEAAMAAAVAYQPKTLWERLRIDDVFFGSVMGMDRNYSIGLADETRKVCKIVTQPPDAARTAGNEE